MLYFIETFPKGSGVLKTIWQWLVDDARQKIQWGVNDCLTMAQSWQVFKFWGENVSKCASTDFKNFLLSKVIDLIPC